MKIDRKLASYLLAIKRNLPNDMQKQFKISAPNIEDVVFDIYQTSNNEKLKRLSKSFLYNSNSKWVKQIEVPQHSTFFDALQKSTAMIDKIASAISMPIRH